MHRFTIGRNAEFLLFPIIEVVRGAYPTTVKYIARTFAITVAFVSATGCITTESIRQNLNAKPSCCKSMGEFKYDALELGSHAAFQLSDKSPVFVFETGKSYFKAFSLPAGGKLLRVSSQPTGSIALETEKYSQAFCPRALFLDEAFNPIFASDSVPNYARGFWSSAFISQFEIPSKGRYVVLHTNPKIYDQMAVRYTNGGGYMVGSAFVFERGGGAIYHPCGPVADALVEVL